MDIREAIQIIEAPKRRGLSVRQSIIAQTKIKTFEITLDQDGRKAVISVQALGKRGAEDVIRNSGILGKIVKIQELK